MYRLLIALSFAMILFTANADALLASPSLGIARNTFANDTIYVRDTINTKVFSNRPKPVSLQYADVTTAKIEGSGAMRTTIHEYYVREIPDHNFVQASLVVVGVTDDGKEQPSVNLRVEEFPSRATHSLLNYIFFDENSSTIPARYLPHPVEAELSYITSLVMGTPTMRVYLNIFNIIGQRMREHPKSVLTITGCALNDSLEKNNKSLAMARAEAVKNFLMTQWQISKTRLKTVARGLPTRVSNLRDPDGRLENCRAEITSNDPEILAAFVTLDTARVPALAAVRFKLAVNSNQGVKGWRIQVKQGETLLKEFKGSGEPPPTLDWDVMHDQYALPTTNDRLMANMDATGGDGGVTMSSFQIPVDVTMLADVKGSKKGKDTIDRYLINSTNFDNDSDKLTAAGKRLVAALKSNLRLDSKVAITGHTDIVESDGHSLGLVYKRQVTVATALNTPDAASHPTVQTGQLFPTTTPEGRFYSRAVQVVVRMPVGN